MAIGREWSKIATGFVGNPEGQHCHWCKHIKTGDGAAWCNQPGAIYGDGERIRSWDGEGAVGCGVFKLDPWYEDDANICQSFD